MFGCPQKASVAILGNRPSAGGMIPPAMRKPGSSKRGVPGRGWLRSEWLPQNSANNRPIGQAKGCELAPPVQIAAVAFIRAYSLRPR